MKKLYRKYSYFIIALLFVIVACKKEYVQELRPFEGSFFISSPYINTDSSYTDVSGKRINRIFLNIGSQASFADGSQGAKARKWFVEDGSGDILGSANDTTSTEQQISVKYNKAGFFKVRLLTNFQSDSLGKFVTQVVRRPSTGAIDSLIYTLIKVKSAQDTTIYVQVLDSLKADFNTTTGVKTFESQQPISFKSLSKGLPIGYRWAFAGSTTPTSTSANPKDIIYKKSGIYPVSLLVTRPNLLYNNAKGGKDSILKTGFITIIPSTQPLNFRSGLVAADNKSIQLSFNQDISELPAGSVFTVKADGVTVPVSSVLFTNPNTDESVLTLNFTQAFPKGAEIIITSTTNIKADGKNLSVAINKTFLAPFGNIFPPFYGSMEGNDAMSPKLFMNGSTLFGGSNTASYWRNGPTVVDNGAVSSTDAFQGKYSMQFNSTAINGFVHNRFLAPYFEMTANKKYRIVAYVKTGGTAIPTAGLTLQLYTQSSTLVTGLVVNQSIISTWSRVSADYTVTGATGGYYLRFVNLTANAIYLIDEVSVFEIP